jgi:hypothetical protein
VDVRRAAFALARALATALYVARRCRDSPRRKIRTWEAETAILDAASTLPWMWPMAHKALRKELKRLGGEAPVQSLDAVVVVELWASAAASGGEAHADASALTAAGGL